MFSLGFLSGACLGYLVGYVSGIAWIAWMVKRKRIDV
jgi:hypothetical protein